MTISTGTRLGPYEILAPIGAGGMGEVYRARDTRLDRAVAVKVLPGQAAGREQLRERLAREAKLVSSLNHPHICALYDVGQHDGVDYLVMEYLEGETLAAHLRNGPLPLPELLRCAMQLADALAVAHKRGLVHRDLKPGNVMLTPAGAKLLDFGLAKSLEPVASPPEMTAAPTAISPLTAQGMIVGTYQYMAPELLEGGEADARSDIFAFGAVLYEMATGRPAFEGKTQASLIASLLKEAPRPLSELAPLSPPALSRLVQTCLEKDPDARRQTMSDVLLDLRWIAEAGSEAGVPVPVVRRRKMREIGLGILALAAVTTAATFAVLWQRAAARPERVLNSSIVAPSGVAVLAGQGLALSPDGSQIAFIGSRQGEAASLWVRPLDGAGARPLPETTGANYPFWAPDSQHLGFFADGKLKRVDSRGGPTQVLAGVSEARGGTWGPDGTIVFSPNFRGTLQRVPSTGGASVEVTRFDDGRVETSHRWPWFLPGGKHVLFLSQTHEGGSPDDRSRIELLNLKTGDRTDLFLANSSIQYVSTGHILFWSQGALYARPFDAANLRLTGEHFPVADKVLYTVNEMAAFSAAEGGLLVYQGGEGVTGLSTLAWFDRSGKRGAAITDPGVYFSPRLSGDGRMLVYERQGDVWVHDLVRGAATRLSFDPGDESDPVWSPDGRWVLYTANKARDFIIYRKLASNLGAEEEVYRIQKQPTFCHDWSRDGMSLLLHTQAPGTDWDILSYSFKDKKSTPLLESPFWEGTGRFSPDGEWFAYTSNESGQYQVYVVRLSGPGGRWQISTEYGWAPAWRRDGREIFYVTENDRGLMSVEVELGETLKAGIPRLLFEAPLRPSTNYPYEPTADGQRFILNVLPESTTVSPLTLLQNWTAGAGH